MKSAEAMKLEDDDDVRDIETVGGEAEGAGGARSRPESCSIASSYSMELTSYLDQN